MKTKFFKVSLISLWMGSLFFSGNASGQKFMEIVNKSKNKKFSEIVEEIEEYYEREGIEKEGEEGEEGEEEGGEYNQFQRWKYFNQNHLSASGKLVNVNQQLISEIKKYNAFQRKKLKNARVSATSTTGNWVSVGPTSDRINGGGYSNGLGRVNCITVDPSNNNIIYVGAPSGGLWRSTDAGATWSPLTDNYLATVGVSGIAIDYNSPVSNRTIYILTGDGDGSSCYSVGVLKSTDNGTTWNTTGLSFSTNDYRRGFKLLIHPTNNQMLFAAFSDGIYKTSNGGSNWDLKFGVSAYDIEFKPGNPSIMYLASGNYFYRSTNTGDAWTNIASGVPSNGTRLALAVTPANPNYVYLLNGYVPASGQFGGVYRSTDSGLNFSLRSNTPNILGGDNYGYDDRSQAWYDLAIAASPTNAEEVHVGGINCWKSLNGGADWSNTSYWIATAAGPGNYTHADIHALEYINPTLLLCGSDGGIYKSVNAADDWTNITAGLSISQIYRIGLDQSNLNRIVCGAQDNGMNILTDKIYNQWFGADGFEGFVDPVNPNTIYGEYQNGGLLKSTDGGQSVAYIRPPITGGNWLTEFVMDPQNNNTIYAGFDNLWKSTDGGTNWTAITNSTMNSGAYVDRIAIAPSNNKYIYILKGGAFYRTRDGGNTWTDKTSALINSTWISYMAVNPTNPDEIWMTGNSYISGQKVYRSLNGGDSWVNVSGSLPNVSANCIVLQKNTSIVYVGTDIGVFYRDNDVNDWVMFSTGLPYTIVNELEIHYASGKLVAGTYGRGVFISDLRTPSCAPYLLVAPAAADICPGQSITLVASGSSTSYSWSPASGLDKTTGSTVVANPSVTTTYIVTGSITGCDKTSSTNVVVTVNPEPKAAVSPASATVCTGGSVTLTASATGAAVTSYSWSPATGLNTTSGSTVIAKPTSTTTYTVTAKSDKGCIGTATSVVTINPNCNVTVWFKAKTANCVPKIHYWNVVPGGGSSTWPGVDMTADATKGAGWYKYTIQNASSSNLLFHDQYSGGCNTYKSADQVGITGGCFDASTNTWVNCNTDNPPVLSISPKGGNYTSSQTVTLSATDDKDANPVIYYTTDGSTPTTSSSSFVKQGTITISTATTLKVFAKDNAGNSSAVQTESYTFNQVTGVTVWFKAKTANCLPKIHYWNVVPGGGSSTWPGVDMTADATKGAGWFKYTIQNASSSNLLFHDQYSGGCNTYKSADQVGITGGCFDASTNTWVNCNLDNPPVLSISPKGGNYTSSQTVTLSATDDKDANPVIYYTIDGSTPTTTSSSFVKQGTITISTATTLKVFAKDNAGNSSAVQTESYTFNQVTGVTVWFKAKTANCVPKIHYWNVVPGGGSSTWPGVDMTADATKGSGWYKYTIQNASSTNLLFHDQYSGGCNTYKSADQVGITGGCFDASTNTWVACDIDNPPVITVSPKGGNYQMGVTACISVTDDKDASVTFYYTTDGTKPTTASSSATNYYCLGITQATRLWVLAVDSKNNQTYQIEDYTFNSGLTVWFKKPSTIKEPKIHYWNVVPSSIAGTVWDGVFMTKDATKGTDWYKYTITGATQASMLFHDANGYKTADLLNITGGCFDGNTKQWINCSSPEFSESLANDLVLGIGNADNKSSLSIHPNPASGSFSIEYFNGEAQSLEIKMTDIVGREKIRESFRLEDGRVSMIFSTEEYVPGIYFISVNDGKSITTRKLVIQ